MAKTPAGFIGASCRWKMLGAVGPPGVSPYGYPHLKARARCGQRALALA